jgi:hypothetical protein
MALSHSRAEHSVVVPAEPKRTAEVCIAVMNSLGKVVSVSRETGIITGKSGGFWTHPTFVTVKISKHPEGTQVQIEAERKEWTFSDGGAQKYLSDFMQQLGGYADLNIKKTSGW